MNSKERKRRDEPGCPGDPHHPATPVRCDWAWAPIPVLLLMILALWMAGTRTSHESRALLLWMNVVFTGLTSLCIAWLAGRSFLAEGQPGLVMLGCGALVWSFSTLAASVLVNSGANIIVTSAWRISLDAAGWDDHLLRALTPLRLWALPPGWRYGLAAALAALATVLHWAILPWIETEVPYNVALIASVLSTILLGIGPGLLCLLLAEVAVEVWIVGSFATGPEGAAIARLAFSMAIGAFVDCVLHGARVGLLKSQKSEARLNALYASMTEGLASHEVMYAGGKAVDYILTEVNPAFERITGIARERAVGARASALFGGGGPPYLDTYARVAESGKPESFETNFAPMDKSFHISVFSPGQGLFATLFEDITARKQAEAALRGSEERFRSVAERSSEGLMLFNPQGSVIYQNPASLRLHGHAHQAAEHGELKILPVLWECWDEQGRPLPFDEWPISRVLRGERIQNQVLRARRSDTGLEFDASYNGCPIYDDAGKMALGFITIRDVSEQKKAQENQERLLALMNHNPSLVFLKDESGRYVYLNQAYQNQIFFIKKLVGQDGL